MENLVSRSPSATSDWSDSRPAADLQRKCIRVLLAEDHPVNLLVLQHQLAGMGLTVVTAANGQQALELFERGGLDLVFCDCHMPVMDGYEFSRRARQHEQRMNLSRTPIIAFTGSMGDEDGARCQHAGMDAVLNKPAGLAQLRLTLSRWLPTAVESGLSSALSEVDSLPVIDVLALIPTGSGDGALTQRLLERFRVSLVQDSAQLLDAIDHTDFPAIARWGHRMKGASLMIGARRLAGVCRMLETVSVHGALGSLRKAFVAELGRLEVELERELDRAKRLAKAH